MIARRPAARGASGQTLVEFALVIPLFVFLVLGVVDFGRAVYAYNTIANAARVGARVAAVNQLAPPDSTTICAADMPIQDPANPRWSTKACAAAAATALGVTTSDVSVAYSSPPGSGLACSSPLHIGCIASVTVTYRWSAITPVIGQIVGPIAMGSTSEIPIERVFP